MANHKSTLRRIRSDKSKALNNKYFHNTMRNSLRDLRLEEDKAKADIRLLEQALELYRLDMISYPNSREGLQALVTVPENHRFKERYRSGGYVRRLEKDPWGNDYKYRRPGRFGTFDLYSLGADGEEGGEGSDKDIGNWE